MFPPPATDSGRTDCSYSLVPASAGSAPLTPPLLLTFFLSCPRQRNPRMPVPVPVTGMHYNSLL